MHSFTHILLAVVLVSSVLVAAAPKSTTTAVHEVSPSASPDAAASPSSSEFPVADAAAIAFSSESKSADGPTIEISSTADATSTTSEKAAGEKTPVTNAGKAASNPSQSPTSGAFETLLVLAAIALLSSSISAQKLINGFNVACGSSNSNTQCDAGFQCQDANGATTTASGKCQLTGTPVGGSCAIASTSCQVNLECKNATCQLKVSKVAEICGQEYYGNNSAVCDSALFCLIPHTPATAYLQTGTCQIPGTTEQNATKAVDGTSVATPGPDATKNGAYHSASAANVVFVGLVYLILQLAS
ncbi:UNVERIFIED_CONTAM: hypothetical protein HDU68_009673 [Siphonaria sp. JEL0065]|nr:hypothetical protein HDU68_009673 [Siphonaria sp. JEL0065]